MASIPRDYASPPPGMHRDHNALPSQTDGQTDRQTDGRQWHRCISARCRLGYILHLALKRCKTCTNLQRFVASIGYYNILLLQLDSLQPSRLSSLWWRKYVTSHMTWGMYAEHASLHIMPFFVCKQKYRVAVIFIFIFLLNSKLEP